MIQPGNILSNADLQHHFKVGNMGGMRRSLLKNALVIVSDHTKSLYDDRWIDDVLHYTGMGKSGPQKLESQNRTLLESGTSGVAVHLFEVFQSGRYIYSGQVGLATEPYQEQQYGEDGQLRPVWMFPLRLQKGGIRPVPEVSEIRRIEQLREKALSGLPQETLKVRATTAIAKPSKRSSTAEQFIRNPYVTSYVKKAAKGICDLCRNSAPFSKNGEPYFHCHHVLWLSRGGPDIIQNAVALCPNCHARMHELDRRADIQVLAERIRVRDPDLPHFDVFASPQRAC
ncbi:HNH endonuclease [Skermanella rosea]|uniref:HNH endonuclease n=1 Tax=Skermanella rosea TaxID=1817965 RepID=UPI00193394AB|nr:HNH endonuclease [Skermanella rosea]UEM03280.1 HNH endonuclease [Skermanella rosea]